MSQHLSPHLQRAAEQTVAQMVRDVKGVLAALVSTEDGLEVAARALNASHTDRLAAMVGSLAALGQVAGEESDLGSCESVVVETAGGHIVMTQARCAQATLIVSLITSREAILGQLLFSARQAARQLEQS